MAKYIEKNGPFLVTFITVVFSWCYIDYIGVIRVENLMQ